MSCASRTDLQMGSSIQTHFPRHTTFASCILRKQRKYAHTKTRLSLRMPRARSGRHLRGPPSFLIFQSKDQETWDFHIVNDTKTQRTLPCGNTMTKNSIKPSQRLCEASLDYQNLTWFNEQRFFRGEINETNYFIHHIKIISSFVKLSY